MGCSYESPIAGYDVIGELNEDGLDYEWHALSVLRRTSDGRLFYIVGSGCSCDGPLEGVCESDLVPVDDGQFWADVSAFPAAPHEKPTLFALARKSFGANVYVTSDGAFLS